MTAAACYQFAKAADKELLYITVPRRHRGSPIPRLLTIQGYRTTIDSGGALSTFLGEGKESFEDRSELVGPALAFGYIVGKQ